MSGPELWDLFVHCLTLSLLAIGGAVGTAPDLQRYVVMERGWISAAEFTSAMALAQAAPGPNLTFIPVVGFEVGGLAGAVAALVGMLLPSTVLTLAATRWGARRRDSRGVQAFVTGMAPVTLGLVSATGLLLAAPVAQGPVALALVAGSTVLMWQTKVHPLWLICAGAAAGLMGWV